MSTSKELDTTKVQRCLARGQARQFQLAYCAHERRASASCPVATCAIAAHNVFPLLPPPPNRLIMDCQEWWAAMYADYRSAFERYVLPDRADLETFWARNQQSPFTDNLAERPLPDQRHLSVPLAVHADGVQVTGLGKTWAKGLDAWSLASLLHKNEASGLVNLLVALIPYELAAENTACVLKVLRWSLAALAKGRWPSRDADGQPWQPNSPNARRANTWLAAGYRGLAVCIKGDLDFILKGLDGPNYNSREPCSLCECNDTTIPWMDQRSRAAWRRHPRVWQSPSALFAEDALHLGRICPDFMHSKHLGSDCYLLGSVFTILAYERMIHALFISASDVLYSRDLTHPAHLF